MTKAERIQEATPEPDFYSGQSWMVGEIVLAHQILTRKINDLRARNQDRTAVGQKLAAEEVSKIAGQLKVCADIIVKQSAEYLNRSARL
jgi:hypothetical protein